VTHFIVSQEQILPIYKEIAACQESISYSSQHVGNPYGRYHTQEDKEISRTKSRTYY
jgi:hypothetical protein